VPFVSAVFLRRLIGSQSYTKFGLLEMPVYLGSAGRTITLPALYWLAVWLSGNALASIDVVALRQTRLVLGWVTVCGRVNHLGM